MAPPPRLLAAVALAFASLLPAAAGEAPLPGGAPPALDPAARRALTGAGGSGSVHRLLQRAYPMAREWSPGAALYSVLGVTPRNEKMWEPEKWALIFGDPGTRDGLFEIVFHDDAIHSRTGVRESVRMKEFFKEGKFESRHASLVEWTDVDYDNCRPIAPKFIDSPELAEKMRAEKIRPGQMDQYRIALLNAVNDNCDGLGALSQFISEKPIPKKQRKRSLWIVSGDAETVYFDAVRAKVVLRRERQPFDAAPGPAE